MTRTIADQAAELCAAMASLVGQDTADVTSEDVRSSLGFHMKAHALAVDAWSCVVPDGDQEGWAEAASWLRSGWEKPGDEREFVFEEAAPDLSESPPIFPGDETDELIVKALEQEDESEDALDHADSLDDRDDIEDESSFS